MAITYNIAGYCRISVDEELDRDNTSIENQRSIIADFVKHKFPGSQLTFFEDRDRSGYTFEQREGYQRLRPQLMDMTYDILVVKDFSRFSRRNSKGLVELEDLRDAGLRIISIGDSIDYPTYDDWTAIQFRFLINEMPVTDTSKKVKSVIRRRQSEGKWICAVPYGYILTDPKAMVFHVDEAAADVVRKVFELYNGGWGYKRIANYLSDQHIPTPRMAEKARKESAGVTTKLKAREDWSIVTVEGILRNDFYIGTLRQGKYRRKKINGDTVRAEESNHVVFENHHEPLVDYRTFALTQELLKKRTTSNYRGVKKYDNVYSGFLLCGDCGAPMFAMSRQDLAPAYNCGTYHRRGTKGCTAHHTRVDMLDSLLKGYLTRVRANSAEMIDKLTGSLRDEKTAIKQNADTISVLAQQIEDAKTELKMLARQKARDILKNPDKEDIYTETYDEMMDELSSRIAGLTHQVELTADRRNTVIRVNRIAHTALEVFDEVITKDKLDKSDLELILDKIVVYEDHIDIKLKTDIDTLLRCGELSEPEENVNFRAENANFTHDTVDISSGQNTIAAARLDTRVCVSSQNHRDKVYSVRIIRGGSPSRMRMVRRISLGMTTRPRSSMRRTIPVAFMLRPPAFISLRRN